MSTKLAIPIAIIALTVAAGGAWVYMMDKTVPSASADEKVATADPAVSAADAEDPSQMAQRDLGRLSRHFKSAKVPDSQKKSAWGLW